MKPWMKISLGIFLSIFIIAFIVVWDTVIKDRIDSVDVVVVKPGVVIEKHHVLKEEDLMLERRNRATLVEGVVYKIKDVVGYEAKQRLYGNTILSERDVEFTSFTPNAKKGEAIRPIPNEWIYAAPSTIRRKDYIDFYLFKPEGITLEDEENVDYKGLSPEQKAKLEELNTEREKENDKYKEDRENIAKGKGIDVEETVDEVSDKDTESIDVVNTKDTVEKGEAIPNNRQDTLRKKYMSELGLTEMEWNSLVVKGDIPLLVDIPIIYVKDGSGNEIQNGENSTEEKRLTSTGAVTDLEVILSEDEYRLIKGYMEKGYTLYITYN